MADGGLIAYVGNLSGPGRRLCAYARGLLYQLRNPSRSYSIEMVKAGAAWLVGAYVDARGPLAPEMDALSFPKISSLRIRAMRQNEGITDSCANWFGENNPTLRSDAKPHERNYSSKEPGPRVRSNNRQFLSAALNHGSHLLSCTSLTSRRIAQKLWSATPSSLRMSTRRRVGTISPPKSWCSLV
jgi:hypothetical protein